MATWTTTQTEVTWTAVDDPSVTWTVQVGGATGGGSGDVVGPSSVTADRPAVFNGTTGKLLKQGTATGGALVNAADAAAARTALGLGTAATSATGDFDAAGTAAAAVTAHEGDTDPHGDRAYADALVAGIEAGGIVAVQGILPASLDVSGGTFTTLDVLGVDGSTVIVDDLPRAFGVGLSGLIVSGANAGVWTITASGACTQTEVLGGQLVAVQESGLMAGVFIGTNTDGPNSTLDTAEPATAFTLSPSDWDTLTDIPARISSLESFVRPTVIFSRMHHGGEDGLANFIDPTTKIPNGSYSPGDDLIIDGLVWAGGTIYLEDQDDWTINGPWQPDPTNPATAAMTRPTALNGWVTDEMQVEGTLYWIGSGERYRLTKWATQYGGIVPTDPFHVLAPDTPSIRHLEGGTAATDGQVLTRDSGEPKGYSWATPSGGSSPLTHIASVGAQTSRDATAMNTGDGAQLLDTAIDLGTADAGDCYHFCGYVALLNDSGGSRNYKPGITIGSTFTQMTANFQIATNASTFVVRIEGNINLPSTGVQQFGVETTHPNSTLAGVAASSATEDFTTSKTMQLHWYCNVSTATQSVQLLSLQVWKVSAP